MPLARLFKVIVRIRGNLGVVFPRKYEMVPLGAGLEPLFCDLFTSFSLYGTKKRSLGTALAI